MVWYMVKYSTKLLLDVVFSFLGMLLSVYWSLVTDFWTEYLFHFQESNIPRRIIAWTLNKVLIRCPETSVTDYQSVLCNMPEREDVISNAARVLSKTRAITDVGVSLQFLVWFPSHTSSFSKLVICIHHVKGKAFPVQVWTGPWGSQKLRLQNF